VHGSCSSRGCFAMTDEAISEVYAVAREAFAGGQRSFQFQSYPFRMTAENLAKHRADPHIAFWRNLKEGSDQFEVAKQEPTWAVAGGRYAFNGANSTIIAAVAAKQARDEREVADLVTKGTPAIRLVYDDGGGHQSFREVAMAAAGASAYATLDDRTRRSLGDISRPDALAAEPREVPIVLAAVKASRAAGSPIVPQPVAPETTPKPPKLASSPANNTVVVASVAAEPSAPVAATPKPLYQRMLGGLLGR
jgi:hypothetical protein